MRRFRRNAPQLSRTGHGCHAPGTDVTHAPRMSRARHDPEKTACVTVFPDYWVSVAPRVSFDYRQLFESFEQNPQGAAPTPENPIADRSNNANDPDCPRERRHVHRSRTAAHPQRRGLSHLLVMRRTKHSPSPPRKRQAAVYDAKSRVEPSAAFRNTRHRGGNVTCNGRPGGKRGACVRSVTRA